CPPDTAASSTASTVAREEIATDTAAAMAHATTTVNAACSTSVSHALPRVICLAMMFTNMLDSPPFITCRQFLAVMRASSCQAKIQNAVNETAMTDDGLTLMSWSRHTYT